MESIEEAVRLARYTITASGFLVYGQCGLGWKMPKKRFDFPTLGFFRPDMNSFMLHTWLRHLDVQLTSQLIGEDQVKITIGPAMGRSRHFPQVSFIADNPPTNEIFNEVLLRVK